jgi:hypothetical protein
LKLIFNNEIEYYNYWKEVIKKERECEINYFKNLIIKFPLQKREKEGFAVSNLKAKKLSSGLKLIYRFGRDREINADNIKIGDSVIVYPQELEKEKDKGKIFKQGIIGNIENKGNKFLDISFSRKLPKAWNKKRLVVNLYVSEITFKRMLEALEKIKRKESVFNFNLIFR